MSQDVTHSGDGGPVAIGFTDHPALLTLHASHHHIRPDLQDPNMPRAMTLDGSGLQSFDVITELTPASHDAEVIHQSGNQILLGSTMYSFAPTGASGVVAQISPPPHYHSSSGGPQASSQAQVQFPTLSPSGIIGGSLQSSPRSDHKAPLLVSAYCPSAEPGWESSYMMPLNFLEDGGVRCLQVKYIDDQGFMFPDGEARYWIAYPCEAVPVYSEAEIDSPRMANLPHHLNGEDPNDLDPQLSLGSSPPHSQSHHPSHHNQTNGQHSLGLVSALGGGSSGGASFRGSGGGGNDGNGGSSNDGNNNNLPHANSNANNQNNGLHNGNSNSLHNNSNMNGNNNSNNGDDNEPISMSNASSILSPSSPTTRNGRNKRKARDPPPMQNGSAINIIVGNCNSGGIVSPSNINIVPNHGMIHHPGSGFSLVVDGDHLNHFHPSQSHHHVLIHHQQHSDSQGQRLAIMHGIPSGGNEIGGGGVVIGCSGGRRNGGGGGGSGGRNDKDRSHNYHGSQMLRMAPMTPPQPPPAPNQPPVEPLPDHQQKLLNQLYDLFGGRTTSVRSGIKVSELVGKVSRMADLLEENNASIHDIHVWSSQFQAWCKQDKNEKPPFQFNRGLFGSRFSKILYVMVSGLAVELELQQHQTVGRWASIIEKRKAEVAQHVEQLDKNMFQYLKEVLSGNTRTLLKVLSRSSTLEEANRNSEVELKSDSSTALHHSKHFSHLHHPPPSSQSLHPHPPSDPVAVPVAAAAAAPPHEGSCPPHLSSPAQTIPLQGSSSGERGSGNGGLSNGREHAEDIKGEVGIRHGGNSNSNSSSGSGSGSGNGGGGGNNGSGVNSSSGRGFSSAFSSYRYNDDQMAPDWSLDLSHSASPSSSSLSSSSSPPNQSPPTPSPAPAPLPAALVDYTRDQVKTVCAAPDSDDFWALTPPAQKDLERLLLRDPRAGLSITWNVVRSAPLASLHAGPGCTASTAVRLSGRSRADLARLVKGELSAVTLMAFNASDPDGDLPDRGGSLGLFPLFVRLRGAQCTAKFGLDSSASPPSSKQDVTSLGRGRLGRKEGGGSRRETLDDEEKSMAYAVQKKRHAMHHRSKYLRGRNEYVKEEGDQEEIGGNGGNVRGSWMEMNSAKGKKYNRNRNHHGNNLLGSKKGKKWSDVSSGSNAPFPDASSWDDVMVGCTVSLVSPPSSPSSSTSYSPPPLLPPPPSLSPPLSPSLSPPLSPSAPPTSLASPLPPANPTPNESMTPSSSSASTGIKTVAPPTPETTTSTDRWWRMDCDIVKISSDDGNDDGGGGDDDDDDGNGGSGNRWFASSGTNSQKKTKKTKKKDSDSKSNKLANEMDSPSSISMEEGVESTASFVSPRLSAISPHIASWEEEELQLAKERRDALANVVQAKRRRVELRRQSSLVAVVVKPPFSSSSSSASSVSSSAGNSVLSLFGAKEQRKIQEQRSGLSYVVINPYRYDKSAGGGGASNDSVDAIIISSSSSSSSSSSLALQVAKSPISASGHTPIPTPTHPITPTHPMTPTPLSAPPIPTPPLPSTLLIPPLLSPSSPLTPSPPNPIYPSPFLSPPPSPSPSPVHPSPSSGGGGGSNNGNGNDDDGGDESAFLQAQCGGGKHGPFIVTVLDRVQSGLLGATLSNMGITGLYLTFVYGVARLLRFSVANMRLRIAYEDLPSTKRLVTLCNDIYIARAEGELVLEEELFRVLIAIYRCPNFLFELTEKKSKRS